MPNSIDRRTFLSVAALASAASIEAEVRTRPNILIIMADQHSSHALGCYGNRTVQTPNLDRLASRGTLFEHAYCQAPLCVPSRMSFLTGQQPSEDRVWINSDSLPSDTATFAHALGAAGYSTTLIGRMHMNGIDQWHGFEKRLVGDVGSNLLSPNLRGGAASSQPSVDIAGPGHTAYEAFDTDVTSAAVEFLRNVSTVKQPFCAVVGFVLPHSPYVCSKEEWNYYYDRVGVPTVPSGYFEQLHPAVRAWRKARGVEDLTPEKIRRARTGYYGLVTEIDRNVGKIVDTLESLGLDKDTCVLYTSDHGEMAGENGMWWKFNFYEGAVTVPLIVSYPKGFPQGVRAGEIVSLVDVSQTLCEIAGTTPMSTSSGKSLLPLLEGRSVDWPNEALSELPLISPVPATRMIRRGPWKLVNFDGMRPQLFNLEDDPHEFHDLGEDPAYSEVRQDLLIRSQKNWTPEQSREALEYRELNHALIGKWSRVARPKGPSALGETLLWRPPAGANVFPE